MSTSQSDIRATFPLILVVNLLPVAGVVLLDWRVYEATFAYWVEIGLCILLYCGLILFAQQEPIPEAEEKRLHAGTVSVPRRSGSIQPVEWLPPIHYRNVRYIPENLAFTFFFWLFSSPLFVEFGNPDTALKGGMKIGDFVAIYTEAFALKTFGVIGLIFGVRVLLVYREYVGRRQYEQFSPSMLADIPCRIVLIWFVLTIIMQVVVLALDPPLLQTVVLTAVVVSKLAVDWSLIQARHLNNSGNLSRWFVPNKPNSGG